VRLLALPMWAIPFAKSSNPAELANEFFPIASNNAAYTRENASPISGEKCPGDLYFGHYENLGYDIAVVVCLDSASNTGTILQPPAMERLQDVSYSVDGHISFSSEPAARPIHLLFEGTKKDSAIEGKLRLKDTETKHVAETPIKLFQIEKLLPKSKMIGRYSNAEYNEEAGDLTGAEMILFSENEPLKGVISFYLGYWGEPTFAPLFVSEFRKSQDGNYKFTLLLEGKKREYVAKLSPSGFTVAPIQLESWQTFRKISLKKDQQLIPELGK
jgi:hypothetical protein